MNIFKSFSNTVFMSNSTSTIEKLRAFQYRPFVKRVHLLLPNYHYLHTTSKENSKTMVGRKRTEQQFLSFLKKGRGKGSYLITGYRGMGKTTLVNKVVDEYINEAIPTTQKVSISFGQKNITEFDILKQLVYEIKNTFETRHAKVLDRYRALNTYLPIKYAIASFFILILATLIAKNYDFIQDDDLKVEVRFIFSLTILFILISLGSSFWITITKKNNLEAINKSIIKNYEKITYLYDRSTSQFTSEESSGTSASNFPILLSRKRSKSYALAGPKEISNELINIIRHSQIKFVFIFDELDKIDTNAQQPLHYEDTQIQDIKGETFSFDDHRKRKRLILDILSSLKYLITEAEAKFIFIAGSEMFDAALADVSDRHSAISSIFGHIINVDSRS